MVDAGVVLSVYAMLSDFCHPAVGTSFLYFGPGPGGSVHLKANVSRRETRWFYQNFVAIVPSIALLGKLALQELGRRGDAAP
jgi:hypothetical protein